MTPRFIAEPPLPVSRGALRTHLRQTIVRLGFIMWQIVVPFKSRPEEIDPFPAPIAEVTDEQVEQSQWIFDQAEERRVHLEQKAQSTFGLMIFLVPLLSSLFVFISSRAATSGAASRTFATVLLVLSAIFLLLGFVSAVRAVSVKGVEGLFLSSVIDDAGQFREYSKAFHARGLLYCAAMNQAMNDHLAQFVKGAHLLTAAAIVALAIAAVPASVVLSDPSSPTQTKIVGPVDVSSPELRAVGDDVAGLKKDIQTLLSNSQAAAGQLKQLESKVADLDKKLGALEKKPSAGSGKGKK
jgi:hypothetical protein